MQPAFDSFSAFLHMGKHGTFVWSAWGLGVLCLLGLVWMSVTSRKRLQNQLLWQKQKQQVQQQAKNKTR